MNVAFINPFLSAMANVLATMATLEAKPGKVSLKKDALPLGDVTGIISMTSPQTRGSLAISFSEPVILDVTERMLGERFESVDSDVINLVGEITNMVTGGAKRLLEEMGYDFDLATPVVITGKDQKITHVAERVDSVVVPFETDSGSFFVEVCFEDVTD